MATAFLLVTENTTARKRVLTDMAGELSKKIGEEGERIVLAFFKNIGWENIENGASFPCIFPESHKLDSSVGNRSSHGIDLVFSYICPLIPNIRRNILISVKNSSEEKTADRNSVIKNDIKDLDTALKCFRKSEHRRNYQGMGQGVTALDDIGVLLKINKDAIGIKSFLPNLKKRDQIPVEGSSPVIFVENSRFDFIENTIQYIKREFPNYKYQFFHPRNSVSISGEKRQTSSDLLPVHSLPSGPLVFKIHFENQSKLLIISQDAYSESEFNRLVGMALDLTSNWVEVIISFPNYQAIQNEPHVKQTLSKLRDKSYAARIRCDSYEARSRLK